MSKCLFLCSSYIGWISLRRLKFLFVLGLSWCTGVEILLLILLTHSSKSFPYSYYESNTPFFFFSVILSSSLRRNSLNRYFLFSFSSLWITRSFGVPYKNLFKAYMYSNHHLFKIPSHFHSCSHRYCSHRFCTVILVYIYPFGCFPSTPHTIENSLSLSFFTGLRKKVKFLLNSNIRLPPLLSVPNFSYPKFTSLILPTTLISQFFWYSDSTIHR